MTILRYSRSDLLLLRRKKCLCISRTVRRRLYFFSILVHHIQGISSDPILSSKCSSRLCSNNQSPSRGYAVANFLPEKIVCDKTIPVRITYSSREREWQVRRCNPGNLSILSGPIPVISTAPSISDKLRFESRVSSDTRTARVLIQCPIETKRRPRRRTVSRIPSFLLSNVRSLCNKLDEVSFRISSMKPDIAVLTESWLDEQIPDSSVALPSYSVVRKDRNRFGGGILIYISVDFDYQVLDLESISTIDSCDSEILPVIFPTLKLLVVTVYHPFWNDSTRNEQAIHTICDIIEFVFSLPIFDPLSTKIVVCGDFNDLICQLGDLEMATGLSRIVFDNTRGTRVLDQILTNIKSEIVPSVSAPFGRSDHAVVFWTPQVTNIPIVIKKRVRNFSKRNKFQFNRVISLVNWNLINYFEDANLAASVFHYILFALFDTCFPFVTVRFRNCDPPWMSVALKVLINKRDRAYCKGQSSKYRALREAVIKYTRSLKSNYLRRAINNSRDSWNRIRCVARVDKLVTKHQFSACELKDYFSSVFQTDEMTFAPDYSLLPEQPLVVSCTEVDAYLKRLVKGCGGHDGIPFGVFKNNSCLLSSAITHIFNKSFSSGYFPSIFKFAEIVPLPKCVKPLLPTDFRPISVLPVLSKVMEKIIVSRWILPSVASKLNPNQFAYVPGVGKGTAVALTLVNDHVLRFLDRKSGCVRLLAADFSKAFDKLSFDSILSSLFKFELPRQAVLFIRDFLLNRKQRVRLPNEHSVWFDVTSGVPQGSVLGPLLFTLVIDSFSTICDNSVCIKFADDVSILHFVRSASDDSLQTEWTHLEEWSTKVGLFLNYEKSCILDFRTKNCLTLKSVQSADGSPINNVSSLKLLGVTFSCDFSWNSHVSVVVKKCFQRFYILRNLKRANCPSDVIFKCYLSFIRSVLLYCFPCFCNLPDYLFKKLLRVEKRASRFFPGQSFDALNISAENICIRLFRQVMCYNDHPLFKLFDRRCPTRKNPLLLKPPFAKTTRFSKSFIRFGRSL